MVLWVIAVLSVVVFEFGFAMRTEVSLAKNFKEEMELYAIGEGGVQRAITELVYKHDTRVQQVRKSMTAEEIPQEQKEWITDGRSYAFPVGQGQCDIRIMGEGGKISLNQVSDNMLRKIMGQFGLEGEAKDVVVDSILDWRDSDDLYRINGAENDYYQSLKEPYSCKNGNFDSVEELLLVRGVTQSLFYGGKNSTESELESKEKRIGLKDIFSIYATGEQVDINSATASTLRFVLGISSEMAQRIAKTREEKPILNERDLLNRVPELSSVIAQIRNFILYQSSLSFYTLESRANSKDGRAVRGLKAIVKIDPKEKEGYKIVQWVDALM